MKEGGSEEAEGIKGVESDWAGYLQWPIRFLHSSQMNFPNSMENECVFSLIQWRMQFHFVWWPLMLELRDWIIVDGLFPFSTNSILANYCQSTAQRFRYNSYLDELSFFSSYCHFYHCFIYENPVIMNKSSIGKEILR